MTTEKPGRPTPEELLAFAAKHTHTDGRHDEQIRRDLGITPARYAQLLGRLVWDEDALRIDPMTSNRLRRMSMNRVLEQDRIRDSARRTTR